jgi:hypothetical protein
MAKFIIEVPHDPDTTSCIQAVQVFMATGSHFLTHADWGCKDGEHRAWIMVELDSKEEARSILPPVYRPQAKIVQLNRFNFSDMEELTDNHIS